MIKQIYVTIQHAPIHGDIDEWIIDVKGVWVGSATQHTSWKTQSLEGAVTGLPEVLKRFVKLPMAFDPSSCAVEMKLDMEDANGRLVLKP